MTVKTPIRLGDTAAETHFWLTQGMAKAVGASITDAIARGDLTRADLAAMVVRCASCTKSETCVRWMARISDATDAPPAYCLNHEAMEALKARADRRRKTG